MNLYKFFVHSLSVIKINRKSIEFTSDLNGLIDIISSAFFGVSSSSTKYFFFMNFVMMDRIIYTKRDTTCESGNAENETFKEMLQNLLQQNINDKYTLEVLHWNHLFSRIKCSVTDVLKVDVGRNFKNFSSRFCYCSKHCAPSWRKICCHNVVKEGGFMHIN